MNRTKRKMLGWALLALLASPVLLFAQPLAGTDDLGRTLSQAEKTGPPKDNRQVAIFYFLWHDDAPAKAWDLSEIYKNHPEAFEDFDSPHWGGDGKGNYGMYYWGQPIYGYYRGDEYWVHLRSMQLLTDAGVDFVVIDATNNLTYPKQADALMRAMRAVNAQGKKAPKIVFYTNTKSGETMQTVYNNFYKPGAPHYYPETWYYLEGKPLVIGISKEAAGKDYETFFTFRESQWPNEKQKINGWPWIEFQRPQYVYTNHKGEREIVNVAVAQHPNPTAGMGGSAFYGNKDNWGRSYRNGSMGNPEKDIFYGYNVQEQWDFAIKQNVPFIYVTGWNEWIAGKFPSHDKNPEHSWFCDQASPEYSRDIEPSLTAGLRDHYYMQLVENIRRYKGTAPNPPLGPDKTIRDWSDWQRVRPEYTDYTGEVAPRNHPGAPVEPRIVYTNTTGRNDFHKLKVARDKQNLYFYAETVSEITPPSGTNWMTLYLDTDRNPKTGWKGYDYRIAGGKRLQKSEAAGWADAGEVVYKTEGNKMMVTVPRKLIRTTGRSLNLEFKWSDNMQDETEPLDWYVNGDTAPGGRFNFIANEK